MAYTTYPSEAENFSSAANNLKEKINQSSMAFKEIKSILSTNEHKDYLSSKTMEANNKLLEAVEKGNGIIDSSVTTVKNIAQKLEEEEKERQELLSQDEDGETSE